MFGKFKILLVFLTLFTFACEDQSFSLHSREDLLTRNPWRMISFVNHDTNTSYEPNDSELYFIRDGKLFIMDIPDSRVELTNWELLEDGDYLKFADNTYKIKSLTKKLLGLQYGSIDIFYEPAD